MKTTTAIRSYGNRTTISDIKSAEVFKELAGFAQTALNTNNQDKKQIWYIQSTEQSMIHTGEFFFTWLTVVFACDVTDEKNPPVFKGE